MLKAYGANTLSVDGTGQKVAIVIDTFALDVDMTSFWLQAGVSQSLTNIEKIQPVAGSLPAPSGEETLDEQWASGMAPGAKVRVYASTSLAFTNIDQCYQAIISDMPSQTAMKQVSISLGLGETFVSAAQKNTDAQYFASMAAGGRTVYVSSGDSGSQEGGQLQVSYFASDPSVTGVGGTSVFLDGSGNVTLESVWSGSGGGISAYFSRPSWQTGTGVLAGTQRLVPDVSAAADPNTGALIVLNGANVQIGGTSWAAPMWGGMSARINQARAAVSQPSLGLLGPKIYPLIGTSCFRDITSGSNGNYSATAGHDMCTGVGSPNLAALIQSLAVSSVANDNFTNAQAVTGASGTVTGSNVGASKESGEPSHAGNTGGHSVWYQWTAPFTGTATFDTLTSNFDTLLGVYTGSAVGTLTEVASNDQANGTNQSLVTFSAVAGTVYQIAVDGWQGATGNIDLHYLLIPANDNFANAQVVTGASGTATGSNINATKESGEPNHAGDTGGHSVWYKWTAPFTGTATFDTLTSDFDTLLGVYTGSAVNTLTEVASNDQANGTNQSLVTFSAVAGTVYQVAVDGWSASAGNITLHYLQSPPVIAVEQPVGTSIPNNDFKAYGNVLLGGSSSLIFTIKDTGNTQLTGLVITKNGTNPADFTVTSNPVAPVVAGGSTTFTVKFAPLAIGSRSAVIHIANNDLTKNPYNITVKGYGIAAAVIASSSVGATTSLGLDPAGGVAGIANEWKLQGLPKTVITTEQVGGHKYLALIVTKKPGVAVTGHVVEVSPNLLDWYSGRNHTTVMHDDATMLEVRDNTPLMPGTKRYIRLK